MYNTQSYFSRILLNSDRRGPNQTADAFTLILQEPIEQPTSIALNKVSFPFTCYNIPKYESTFRFYLQSDPGVVKSFSINCNRVFENPVQLCRQLNADCASAGYGQVTFAFDPDSSAPGYDPNAVNARTYRFTVSVAGNDKISVLGWNSYFNSLNYRLGFTSHTNYGYAASIQAESPPNLTRTTAVYVECDLGSDSMTDNGYKNILAQIPVNGVFSQVVNWQSTNAEAKSTHRLPSYVRSITMRLLDSQLQPLSLPDNSEAMFELTIGYAK